MESNELRSRGNKSPSKSPVVSPRTTLFQLRKSGESRYGVAMELARLSLFLLFFLSCNVAMHTNQVLGIPLYWINKEYFYAYMSFTKQQYATFIILLTQWFAPTPVVFSGDESVKGQFRRTANGLLEIDFPERSVTLSNHQLYTDWLYLWWVSYAGKLHGHVFIVLKEVFKYVPIIGPGMMLFGFIFMTRKWASDQDRMAYRLKKLTTRHGGTKGGSEELYPMWFLMYPEGTNLSANTRRKSAVWAAKAGVEDMRNLVLPRSTGLHFVLSELKDTIDYVYDITVGYGGIPPGEYGQDIFGLRSTYIAGNPPSSVNFYMRRFAVSEIPVADPKEFEAWVMKIWREKDDLLEHWKTHGRFPANPSSEKSDPNSNGWIETEVRLNHWSDATKILGPLLTVALFAGIFARLWNLFFYGKLCFDCI